MPWQASPLLLLELLHHPVTFGAELPAAAAAPAHPVLRMGQAMLNLKAVCTLWCI